MQALCYAFHAAIATCDAEAGWGAYRHWAQGLWSGQIDFLLEASEKRLKGRKVPEENELKLSPRQIAATTVGYVRNQRNWMDYA